MSRRKPWFRLYSEIKQDRKLRRCTGEERWCWIVIMCIASESPERGYLYITDGVPCNFEDIADEAALPVEVVEAAIFKFSGMNMMHQEDGVWVVSKFLDRQYDKPSDRPENTSKRKQKSRDSHADVTTHITDKQTNRIQSTDKDSSCLTTTTAQCAAVVVDNPVDEKGKPTNQELIAELTNGYRSVINESKHADGDYAFVGALYNQHGYDQVLTAINKLELAAATQDLKKPLLYLQGILDKQGTKRDPPARSRSSPEKKKLVQSLYMS